MVRKDLVIVAYDIQSDKFRNKVSKLLEQYGVRANYSVFECRLTKKQLDLVTNAIIEYVDLDTDRVLFYPLCKNCFLNSYAIGDNPSHDKDETVLGL